MLRGSQRPCTNACLGHVKLMEGNIRGQGLQGMVSVLSSSPHSCVTPRGHMGRKRGSRTVYSRPSQDKENLSPRRYTDNCRHNLIFFTSKIPAVRSTPGPGLSLAKPALAPPKMHREGKVSCAPLRSMCLIVFISQLTPEAGRGEKKSKKQGRRNSSVEAISGWEWERVSALMSSLAV